MNDWVRAGTGSFPSADNLRLWLITQVKFVKEGGQDNDPLGNINSSLMREMESRSDDRTLAYVPFGNYKFAKFPYVVLNWSQILAQSAPGDVCGDAGLMLEGRQQSGTASQSQAAPLPGSCMSWGLGEHLHVNPRLVPSQFS